MTLCNVISTREDLLVVAEESTPGTAETLSASSHGLLAQNINVTMDVDQTNTSESTGSLDESVPIQGGIRATIAGEIVLRELADPSQEPEYMKILKAAAFASTSYGSAIPASATAIASGTADTVTLPSDYSNTVGTYNGAVIDLPSVDDDAIMIREHKASRVMDLFLKHGSSMTGDSQIPEQVVASPTSPDQSTMTRLTAGLYTGGKLFRVYGAVATFGFRLQAGQAIIMTFSIQGLYLDPVEQTPNAVVQKTAGELVFRDGFSRLEGTAAAATSVTFNVNNQIFFPPDPEHENGYCAPIITSRRVTAEANPNMMSFASFNAWNKLLANENTHMMFMGKVRGGGAGKRVYFGMNNARVTQALPDSSGEISRKTVQAQLDDADDGFFFTQA